MANYLSIYTGPQIDEAIGLAGAALQPETDVVLSSVTLPPKDPATVPGVGQLQWNDVDGTLDIGLGSAVLQVGQEIHYQIINQSGVTIPEGALVMAVGALGASGRIKGAKAVADGTIPGRNIMGVATQEILNGDIGFVTHFGKVRTLNTSMWAAGDVLWADPAVAGGLTNVEPSAPNLRVAVGFVINSHASAGTIHVRAETGAGLSELHDVNTSSATDGQVLTFDQASGTWVPQDASGGAANLTELGDVAITTPADGEVLTYNVVTGKWENKPASGGGGGATDDFILALMLATS